MWRYAAAALIGGAMALGASGIAAAADPAVTGTQSSAGGKKIYNTDGDQVVTDLMTLTIGTDKLTTYCIDMKHNVPGDHEDHVYQETDWTSSTVKNLEKVQWILLHAYPAITPDQLLDAAGTSSDDSMSQRRDLAYAGTQASIWHFTDGFELGDLKQAQNNNVTEQQYTVIKKVFAYLTGPKNTGESEPKPFLKIDPATKSGEVGTKIGPYTVVSGGGAATLSATGGKLIDKDGKEIVSLGNGGQFWVASDTAGTVQISATGTGKVQTGRVFVWKNGPDRKQKLILAGSTGTPLSAAATATVTPKTPQLPVTGASVGGAIGAGMLLLVGGALGVMAVRRRRIRFTA